MKSIWWKTKMYLVKNSIWFEATWFSSMLKRQPFLPVCLSKHPFFGLFLNKENYSNSNTRLSVVVRLNMFFSVSTPFSICLCFLSLFSNKMSLNYFFFPFVYSFIFASYGSICHQWWVECNHFSSETLMSWLFWIVEQLNLHNSLFFVTFSTFGFSKLIFQYSGNRLLFS